MKLYPNLLGVYHNFVKDSNILIKSKSKLSIILVLLLTLAMGVGAFFVPDKFVLADATYSVTFKYGEQVIHTITKNTGESVTEGEIPSTLSHPDKLPALEDNYYYKWFFSANGQTYFAVSVTNDPNNEIVKNISGDVIFRVNVIKKVDKYHDVTFILPNGSKVTTSVEHGEDAEEPIVELGFLERIKYDKSPQLITEDTEITVTIDDTYKKIFIAGCLIVLVASLVVIVVIVFRVLRVPEDDEEEFQEEITENTLSKDE